MLDWTCFYKLQVMFKFLLIKGDFIFWVKSPLTNVFLIADAVAFAFKIIVTGKPLIEEGRHISGFFIVRLSHSVLLSGPAEQQIILFKIIIPPFSARVSRVWALFFLTLRFHQTQENFAQGVSAFFLKDRLNDK